MHRVGVPRGRIAIAPLVFAGFCAGCSGVLGLDAPLLDPCLSGGAACVDGSVVDAAGFDASPTDANGTADAAKDTGSDGAVPGVRCGGDPYPVTGCTGKTPMCCQEYDDAGDPLYVCTTSAATCDSYSIACSSNANCDGNDVCCHFSSSTKCESSCANGSLVCEPDGPSDQCPSGWKCTGAVDDDGIAAPYFVCAQ